MSNQLDQDDLMSSETNDGKLRLELRKLSNSEGWVSSTHLSSRSNSRASTPLSQKSTSRKGHPKNSKQDTTAGKSLEKRKKFHMVLEKDDDYEVDYLTPDDGDSSASSLSGESLSDRELSDQDEVLPPGSPSSWHEDEEMSHDEETPVPELKLPKSSEDLLLPHNLVLQALSVYEVLRHFRNTLRLSPFLFEDFCAALINSETTVLINECHIMLLKSLLKEEENVSTMFVPPDQKDAYNASLYFIDYLTWPEVLRAYVQSSPNFSPTLTIVEEESFPCVEVAKKIQVLQFLTNLFLSSTKIRDELMMDGSIRYDDHCRVCHRLGDLLCCETCPAVYHLACCTPPLKEVPEEEWQCEICQLHKLNGVSNCEFESEFSTQYIRHDPVGIDRHGRKYWFLARRLFIEGPEETYYYTTYDEFKYVLSKLDHKKYELVLCEALKDVLDEFPRQSKITEELTNEAKWKEDTKTQIDVQIEQLNKTIEEETLKSEKKDEDDEKRNDEKKSKTTASETQTTAVPSATTTATTTTVTSEPPKATSASDEAPNSTSTTTEPTKANLVASEPSKTQPVNPVVTTPTVATPALAPVSAPLPVPIPSPAPIPPLAPVRTDMGRIVLPKANFIPLSIKVPLTRCDAHLQPKQAAGLNSMVKVAPKVQLKSSAPLKNLFVLSKDGVKTPLIIGADGKLTAGTGTNQRFIMINKTAAPQDRLSRELKRLQFAGAGPKMQKISAPGRPSASQLNSVEPVKKPEAPPAPPSAPVPPPPPFKLGEDKGYKQYKNHFTENTLALNKYQHKEDKDKDRHVGYKFSLSGPVEFDWAGTLCGSRDEVVHTMRTALFSFEQHVPMCFMHSRWEQYRKMWARMLVTKDTVKAFAAVLGILEMAIRNIAKKTVWNEGLGQVRLRRITPSEKDQFDKHRKHRSKLKSDVDQRYASWCKYPLPVQISLVTKLRGEDYRVTGSGGWMWQSATFKYLDQKAHKKPFTLFKDVSSDDDVITRDCDVIDVSKHLLVRSTIYNKRWAASKVDKMLRWRILQEKERIQELEKTKNEEDLEKKSEEENMTEVSKEEFQTKKVNVKAESTLAKIDSNQPENSDLSQFKDVTKTEKAGVETSGEKTSKDMDCSLALDDDKHTNVEEPHEEVLTMPPQEVMDAQEVTVPPNHECAEGQKDATGMPALADANVQEENTVLLTQKQEELRKEGTAPRQESEMTQKEKIESQTEEVAQNSEVVQPQKSPAQNHEQTIDIEESEKMEVSSPDSIADQGPPLPQSKSDREPQVVTTEQESMQINTSTPDTAKVNGKSEHSSIVQDSKDTSEMNTQQENVKISESSVQINHDSQLSTNTINTSKTESIEEHAIESVSIVNNQISEEADEKVQPPQPSQDVFIQQQEVRSDSLKTEKPLQLLEVLKESSTSKKSSPTPDLASEEKPQQLPQEEQTLQLDTSSEKQNLSQEGSSPMEQDVPVSSAQSIELPQPSFENSEPTQESSSQKSESQTVLSNESQSKQVVAQSSLPFSEQEKSLQDHQSKKLEDARDQTSAATTEVEPSQVCRISRRFRKGPRQKVVASKKAIAQIWKLSKPASDMEKKKPVKMPLPWNFAVSKEKRKSIFRLPHVWIRHMTCRGGLAWYPVGFRHVQKSPSSLELFWPYHCVRPTIGTVWRYKLQNAKTLASIAHLLRVLWHSMRWEDIVTKPSTDDVIHTIHNDDDIISIELLKRRNIGRTGLRSEYFIRRIVMPSSDYDEEIPRSEAYTPTSRSGLRARSRQMHLRERAKKDLSLVQPKVQTLWVSEDQVELWQIRQFDSMIRMQQKAALARKEAEAAKLETAKALLQVKPASTSEPVKQITISPALLQQANALHRSQANSTASKVVSLDISQVVGNSAKFAPLQPSTAAITFKSSNLVAQAAKSITGTPTSTQVGTTATKILPKKIVVKPGSITGRMLEPEPKAKHPTIKLSGIVATPKASPLPVIASASNKDVVVTPKPYMQHQAPSRATSSMQVKLSAAQLNDLMKVGTDTVVKVSINMPDGSPGVGHLQVIPSGTQVTPSEGQQLMQCKVGNEIKKFLLTPAASTKASAEPSANYPVDNEVSLETPSLRHRLEQLQQRQQELSKPTVTNNFHKLMTDKDPLWGGRTQTPTAEKHPAQERKKEMSSKKKHSVVSENREERQRRNAVQHVIKSILDRIDRKEEMEARRKKKEEREEMQKRKREHMDQAKSQQRMQSRLFQVLIKHEEQIKHDIRRRRALIEKYLIHIVQNELHEEQGKRRRLNIDNTPKSPPKTYNKPSVLAERNNRESPQKRAKRKQPSTIELVDRSPPGKKRKLSGSDKLYCVCKTPYDESRFYIGCDLCMSWFHGECVGISERKAKTMDTWVCRDCKQTTPQQELYCICKTPYDDSQFYIGCDICQDWYHGRCVGISENQANKIESYTCPRCKKQARDSTREKNLTARELAELTRIVRTLQSHKMAWPFLEPVREADAPGYYKVVTRPMDLQTVMKRLQSKYYTKLSDLVGDVSLIFDNCRQFNGPESNLVRCAEMVETVFVGKIRDMRGR